MRKIKLQFDKIDKDGCIYFLDNREICKEYGASSGIQYERSITWINAFLNVSKMSLGLNHRNHWSIYTCV